MYSKIVRNMIDPMIHIGMPQDENYNFYLRLLEKTQWWSTNKLEDYQREKLNRLLIHAYENSPYYHRIFRKYGIKPHDVKNGDELRKLPILTKDIIRNNSDDLIANNYPRNKLIPRWTGGSTGEPMNFFIDKKWAASNIAAAFREWSWAGYNPGDKIAYLWASTHDLSIQANMKNKINNFFHRRIFLDSNYLTEEILDNHIRILRKFKPRIINAIASVAFLMAKYMQKKGIEDIKPKAILTSCEVLFDYQRETIENAFKCKVFDYYSGRDTSLHACECPEFMGYHLSIENAFVEFVKDGDNVSPGELGKIIITDLSNFAMPFIRYEIGDMVISSDEKCSCGRGLPLIKSIEGRTSDILVKTDGTYLLGYLIYFIPNSDIKNIRQIQIIQKRIDKIILKIVRGENYTERDSESIIKAMKSYLGDDMDIQINFVDSIPPSSSGKHRLVISEIEIDI